MRVCVLLLAVLSTSVVATGQSGACTESAVKSAIAKSKAPNALPTTDDYYFFSGALDRPVVGSAVQSASAAVGARRKNESEVEKTDRIVAAASGDMAYEYGTVHISYDDARTGEHADFTSAYLRVWKPVNGACKPAAMMAEPEDTPAAAAAQK
jgi:hypothetical protein